MTKHLEPLLYAALQAIGLDDRILTDEEVVVRGVVSALESSFAQAGVDRTAAPLLCVEDVTMSFVNVYRLEKRLQQAWKPPEPSDPDKEAKGPQALLTWVEAAGKARERMRKAMKELEDSCKRAGTPLGVGLADVLKPILKQGDGVLEEALAVEAETLAAK